MTDPAPPSFYSSSALHVAVYDAMHAAIPGGDDVAFYRSLAARTGGPILELGCGTGRVAIPLAEAGFELVGLDLSPAMLERARARAAAAPQAVADRLRFVQGDMTTTIVGHGFGLVFATFRVFMAILTPEDQLRALATIREQLRPGGLVALDLFDPRMDLLTEAVVPGPADRGTYAGLEGGRTIRVTNRNRRNDRIAQRFVEDWTFEELDAAGSVVAVETEALTLRWTFRHEMRHLLIRAGLEPVAEYGDYAGSPPVYGGEQVWVARRPEA